jgi:hypothetical protein
VGKKVKPAPETVNNAKKRRQKMLGRTTMTDEVERKRNGTQKKE